MQLTQVMAKAVHETSFRLRLLESPKSVLDEMDVTIPAAQSVIVLESRQDEIFFVLPIVTDQEAEHLASSLNTVHPQRSVRSRVLLKARQDPNYKAQLLQEPKAVLIAEGLPIPESATVTVLENSSEQLYLVLPQVH